MMTLVIYDNRGIIYYQAMGDYIIPEGLNYLELEIPEGKVIQSVNPETREPIYADLPASDIELLSAKVEYLAMMAGIEMEE